MTWRLRKDCMSRRRKGKPDKNQAQIIQYLKDIGASVLVTSGLGDGAPDIAVGFRGRNYLFEIKNPENKYYGVSKKQARWHDEWNGHVSVVWNLEEILEEMGAYKGR